MLTKKRAGTADIFAYNRSCYWNGAAHSHAGARKTDAVYNKEEIIKEVKYYFLNMAKETKTLWEHTSILASLNHAFASYCLKFIIFALTSYNIMNKTFVDNQGINIDCDISIPLNISNTKKLIITAKNNTINNKIV